MNVLIHGLLLRPVTQSSPKQLFYEIGKAGRDAFTVLYVGQTGDGIDRFYDDHDGLRRAISRGADTILAAPVYGETNRRAIETMLRFELNPPCNNEPTPGIGDYLNATLVWADYMSAREMAVRQPRNALASAAPMPPAPTVPVRNAFASAPPSYDPVANALLAPLRRRPI